MTSGAGYFNKFFSHVYVEKKAADLPHTKEILSRLPQSEIIYIDHYKDVFNRGRQDYSQQKRSTALILAVNDGELVYKGAPVCQSFRQKDFYYTASSMNCPFNCEYCFLKGMYSTANIVCFVNFEDYAKALLKLDRPYVCVSYDTDLIGLDHITGQASLWAEFAREHPDILIEIRTKAAPAKCVPLPNLIYAFTLSPDSIAKRFEKNMPPLKARLVAASKAMDDGCQVRLCFDPMIYVKDWEICYNELVEQTAQSIDMSGLRDVSIGTFRISSQYLKAMRRQQPYSEICWFPFDNDDGYAVYPEEINRKMTGYMRDLISQHIDGSRIWI